MPESVLTLEKPVVPAVTPVKMMAIMGAPVHCGNRGVLALGAALVNLCSQACQGGKVVLLLANRDNRSVPFQVGDQRLLIPVVHARMSPSTHPRHHLVWIVLMSVLYRLVPVTKVRAAIARSTPWIQTVWEANLVGDVRGGDSFSDIYGLRSFLMGFLMAWTVVLVKGTMIQLPQTYGPYKSPLARWLARYLLRRSSVIIARDLESQKVAQALVGPGREVWLSPDVAFSLKAIRPEPIELEPPLSGPVPSGVIGLNVNGLMYNGGYTRNNMFALKLDYADFLPTLLRTLLAQHPGELWLIPHTYAAHGNVESDNEASQKLRATLPPELLPRVRCLTREYDQHELKGVIGQCDFFIGSRMHACIAALSQGVPCVGVAYSMKFAGVFDSVGMGKWVIDARSSSQAEALARMMALYQERNAARQELSSRSDQARRQLADLFTHLVNRHLANGSVSPK